MPLNEESLYCKKCDGLYHLSCSELPLYMLVHYSTSRVNHMCQRCVGDEEREMTRMKKILENEVAVNAVYVQHALNEGDKEADTEVFEDSQTTVLAEDTEKKTDEPQVQNTEERRVLSSSQEQSVESTQTPMKSTKVCRHYARSSCKYGRLGNGCKFSHPKPCKKFTRSGGCKDGKKCKLFHPPVCYEYRNKGSCVRESCKFLHLKGAVSDAVKSGSKNNKVSANKGNKSNEVSGSQPTTYAQVVTGRAGTQEVEQMGVSVQNVGSVGNSQSPATFLEMRTQMAALQQQMQQVVSLLTLRPDSVRSQSQCQCRLALH